MSFRPRPTSPVPAEPRRERRRLAQGYFWYFATVGLFIPYWPPYLAARGLDPVEIGVVMGVFAATRVIGPPAYAHWADVSGKRLQLLRSAALFSACCAASFHWLGSTAAIVLVMAAYSAAWNGVMSVYDAHVLDRLGADSGRYGLLRLWGSIGFIVLAIAAGPALQRVGLESLPWMLALLILLAWASLRSLGQDSAPGRASPAARIGPLLADRRVLAFLAAAFLMVASHGAYYNFFTLYLAELGYAPLAIGALWAWAVVAEIGVFVAGRWLLERYSLRWMMVTALLATALRWAALAFWPGLPGVVWASQTLHLASFGLFHLCSVALAARLFPRQAAARGQALHGSVGFGLGGMAGAVASGWLWREVSPESAFLAGSAAALLAAAIVAAGLKNLPQGPGQVANA